MADLPNTFVDGNVLPASDLNPMVDSRDGNLVPIDPLTKTNADLAGELGTNTLRWSKMNVGVVTDDIVLAGKTLTTILTETMFDSNCAEFAVLDASTPNGVPGDDLDHIGDIPGNPTGLVFEIDKLERHSLMRIHIGGGTGGGAIRNVDVTVGTLRQRTFFIGEAANEIASEIATDWFDITGQPDGPLTVTFNETSGGAQIFFFAKVYVNAF